MRVRVDSQFMSWVGKCLCDGVCKFGKIKLNKKRMRDGETEVVNYQN